MNIVIVGGGVFTWSFLWQLSQKNISFIKSITLLDGSKEYPASSLISTALIARRGDQFAVSDLGDLIQDSWNWWEHNQKVFQWGVEQGIEKVPIIFLNSAHTKRSNHMAALSKYTMEGENILPEKFKGEVLSIEPAFMFDPAKWLNYLRTGAVANLVNLNIEFNHVLESVIQVDTQAASATTKTKKFQGDKLILQTGAYKLANLELVEKEEIVYGSYLEFAAIENWKSFSFSFSSTYQLYYGQPAARLQLGIYSAQLADHNLENSTFLQFYTDALKDGWKLPPFDQGKIISGNRLKLKKRLPVIGK